MAIVKCKPTSAGRRFVVKVVNKELHKGAPYAPLGREEVEDQAAVTTMAVSPLVTLVVVTSSTIAWSTFVATRMAFQPPLSASNTIRTVLPTSLC
jgi:hypothetical protein